jgi:hypothetical protein
MQTGFRTLFTPIQRVSAMQFECANQGVTSFSIEHTHLPQMGSEVSFTDEFRQDVLRRRRGLTIHQGSPRSERVSKPRRGDQRRLWPVLNDCNA